MVGSLIVFGQDFAGIVGAPGNPRPPFLFSDILGAEYLQDSINGGTLFTNAPQLLSGVPRSPFASYAFDISGSGDGAGNQLYIDEIWYQYLDNCTPDDPSVCADLYRPLLTYSDGYYAIRDATVAMSHRDQPSLEQPGTTFAGDALYFAFGLRA